MRTARLLLRPLAPSDADAFAALNADARVMRYFPAPLTREESDALLARLRVRAAEDGFTVWAVEVDTDTPRAAFAGIVGLARATFEAAFTPCVEAAWRLAEPYWSKGYATEAARASLDFGFGELALDEVFAWTTPANAPSRRVMQRIGMTRVPELDFDHPRVPEGSPVRPHVVYRIEKREHLANRTTSRR